MSPQPSNPAPQGWLATPSTPLNCGMASCWQINSILANSGGKNSIQILSIPSNEKYQYEHSLFVL